MRSRFKPSACHYYQSNCSKRVSRSLSRTNQTSIDLSAGRFEVASSGGGRSGQYHGTIGSPNKSSAIITCIPIAEELFALDHQCNAFMNTRMRASTMHLYFTFGNLEL